MKARAVIAFFLLVLLALGAIGWLGLEISRNDAVRDRERFRSIVRQQLDDLDAAFQRQLLDLERELVHGYDHPEEPAPLALHGFRLDPQHRLVEPRGSELPPRSVAFLKRTRIIWESGIRLADDDAEPVRRRVETRAGSYLSRSSGKLRSLPDARPTGWHAWFYDNDVHLLHWMRLDDGSLRGAEINRPAFLARLIGALPGGDSLPDARIILRSATGQSLYQWGDYVPPDGEAPALTLALAPPLETWSLHYHSGLAPTAGGPGWPVLLNLSGLALLMLVVAAWFLRENNRALRLAARRVSFVNQVSHELRTPLTNIRLYTELAAGSLPEGSPAAPQLEVVAGETRRLSRLIHNVLSFARSENRRTKLHPRVLDLHEVVHDALGQWQPALERAGIAIDAELDDDGRVVADRDACDQILGNLLSNLEKYAASGGLARIRSRVLDGMLQVEVSDRGPGIPRAARERIFRPFARLDSSLTEGSSGTGIGLTIARDLARALGGDLVVARQERGACFHWTLPRPDEPA